MNKNGFIATSLIYSFFLIFVTLFLTIIADYLQNKVLLNTIEKGIKDEINSTMGINDFEVGDMVSFVSDCDVLSRPEGITNQWVIVNVNYIDKKVIFYSYDFVGDVPEGFASVSDLNKSNIDTDIEFGYRNHTYFNKILYTFATKVGDDTKDKYLIDTDTCVSISCDGSMSRDYNSGNNCIEGCTDVTDTRKRLEVEVGDTKYNKCVDDSGGAIILDV